MAKIHVVLKKEDIKEEKVAGNIAIVLDVLLATSTITACLHHGARGVLPVINGEKALELKANHPDDPLLVGEYEGKTIDGFLLPTPLSLKEAVKDKMVILSTTNGTVAIHRALTAKKTYIASLLNGEAVCELVKKEHSKESIIIICSGSSGEFNLEDFYGAGYLLDLLQEGNWELTDAARAALLFYQAYRSQSNTILKSSHVGQVLECYGYVEELTFVSEKGTLPVVPYVNEEQIVVLKEEIK